MVFYGLLLSSNSARIAPITTITTIIPIDNGRKYMSAVDAGLSVGAAVASGAASTTKALWAYDG